MTVDEATPRRQHAVLVLPSSGAFDSRTYRIATTLVARGHQVTVLARLAPGLEVEEEHPAGYRIIRLRVMAEDGLPFQGLLAVARRLLAGARGGRRPSVGTGPRGTATPPAAAAMGAPQPVSGGGHPEAAAAPIAAEPLARRPSPPRRMFKALVRRFALPLTIRAHIRAAKLVAPGADLYHGMAYMGIPVALALGRANHAPVVYDARDIYMEARSFARKRGLVRRVLATAERRWAAAASRVITVNEDYADQMARRLGVLRPLVVMNCSYRFQLPEPRERRFHDLLGLDPAVPLVIYHGGLFPERGIEQLMTAILDVPDAVLILMGYGALEAELRARCAEAPFAGRVRLVPPVPPEALHEWLACADVAAMPVQASTLNHRLTTPNKLFEAMASGVPVVASDLPGMARIVGETGCGVLCDPTSPLSIAAALREVLADPEGARAMGARGHAAALATYNWERQAGILLRQYGALTGRPW